MKGHQLQELILQQILQVNQPVLNLPGQNLHFQLLHQIPVKKLVK